MPQPITRTASSAARAIPRQRGRSRPALLRQLREQDWRTLVVTYRLLSLLQVERCKHHLVDEADDYARQARAVVETGRLGVAGPHRQRRGGPLQGLDLRLLVHAEH